MTASATSASRALLALQLRTNGHGKLQRDDDPLRDQLRGSLQNVFLDQETVEDKLS